jgi:K+-sensing histidine kinase KdpD
VVVCLTIAVAVYFATKDALPEVLQFDFSSWITVVLLVGLGLAFLIYVLEKERNLRRLATLLVEERVLSAALSNRLAELSRLTDLGKAVNTTLDLQDVLHLIISSALELLGGTEGSIMLFDEEQNHLRVVAYEGPRYEAVMGGTTAFGNPVAGLVAETREPKLLRGIDPDRSDETRPYIRSAVCVPLIRSNEMLGVLNLNETEGQREFSEQDLDALEFFAQHAAIAISNAGLYAKERETVAQLEELDRLKSDFVATISHELKTPLTAIIGAAKTVGRKGPSMEPDQHAEFMDMIDRQGNRLLRLIDDVLVAARIESGLRVLRREHLDLRGMAQQVIQEVLLSHPDRERDVLLRCEPEQPLCWADHTSALQILTNLLDNALKYSDVGSKVIIFVGRKPDEAILEVADHGQGIDRTQLDSIFDRFRQADSASTRPAGGVGLGLFIVKNLVDAHGGTIDVDSERGAGTTFTIRLPQREQPGERRVEATQ